MKRGFTYLLILLLLGIGSFFIYADTPVYRGWGTPLLKTGQTTSYVDYDDGYYEKGIAKSYTVLTAGQFADTKNIDLTHLVSDTGAFTVADQTYTDAGKCGVFKAAGGETIVITGSASNNGTFTSASATADTVVVTAGFVNEADAPSTTFKKREAHSNNCVLDNNTGLMWSRYTSDKMGTGGDGKLPWTTHANGYGIFSYCAAANVALLGGYGDWRIPNDMELASLRDVEQPTAAPDAVAFPDWPTSSYFWSATTEPDGVSNALIVHFGNGNTRNGGESSAYFVALVRGG